MPSPSQHDQTNQTSLRAPTYQDELRQSFAYYADQWDDGNLQNHYRIKLNWLLENISSPSRPEKHQHLKILDVGCGNGMYLRDIVGSSNYIDAVGVDITEEMILAARQKTLDIAGNYQWIQMDLENDSYEEKLGNQKFDVIIMTGVICYFQDITTVLQHLKNILQDHGKLIVIHHNPDHLTNLVLRIQSFLEPHFIWVDNPSKAKIITCATSAGYTLQKIKRLPCGGLPNILYDVGTIFWDGYGFVFRAC